MIFANLGQFTEYEAEEKCDLIDGVTEVAEGKKCRRCY